MNTHFSLRFLSLFLITLGALVLRPLGQAANNPSVDLTDYYKNSEQYLELTKPVRHCMAGKFDTLLGVYNNLESNDKYQQIAELVENSRQKQVSINERVVNFVKSSPTDERKANYAASLHLFTYESLKEHYDFFTSFCDTTGVVDWRQIVDAIDWNADQATAQLFTFNFRELEKVTLVALGSHFKGIQDTLNSQSDAASLWVMQKTLNGRRQRSDETLNRTTTRVPMKGPGRVLQITEKFGGAAERYRARSQSNEELAASEDTLAAAGVGSMLATKRALEGARNNSDSSVATAMRTATSSGFSARAFLTKKPGSGTSGLPHVASTHAVEPMDPGQGEKRSQGRRSQGQNSQGRTSGKGSEGKSSGQRSVTPQTLDVKGSQDSLGIEVSRSANGTTPVGGNSGTVTPSEFFPVDFDGPSQQVSGTQLAKKTTSAPAGLGQLTQGDALQTKGEGKGSSGNVKKKSWPGIFGNKGTKKKPFVAGDGTEVSPDQLVGLRKDVKPQGRLDKARLAFAQLIAGKGTVFQRADTAQRKVDERRPITTRSVRLKSSTGDDTNDDSESED